MATPEWEKDAQDYEKGWYDQLPEEEKELLEQLTEEAYQKMMDEEYRFMDAEAAYLEQRYTSEQVMFEATDENCPF